MSSRRPGVPLVRAAVLGVTAALLVTMGVVIGAVWPGRDHDSSAMSLSDIGFAQDMSTHHDQAILMSRTIGAVLGVTPQIRGVADRIVYTQTAETATMRGWLQWFDQPITSTEPMSWMSGGHSHHGAGPDDSLPPMPGMASIDEVGRLSTLPPDEAEILFLQLMIRHHRGGMSMAQAAYNDARSGSATKDLALMMIGDQGDEIGVMTMLLKERGADPLPT
ncbi:DUF305 domain-containing protein [Gordonia McavH-238-E]|uniref:DUF305 domain-containing protein n=1 Tax=Gordonia sp. McavH-238-E TaxID=2917736 RepID=UPI001EF3EDBB|nr:DUF305 domain-containing protein [Gordonia sp. McavH-238-E]MCG7631887.1 DUF305 domain-containing protein [Gordonia sp. McavH-238-E]